jgi:hypothetical protein
MRDTPRAIARNQSGWGTPCTVRCVARRYRCLVQSKIVVTRPTQVFSCQFSVIRNNGWQAGSARYLAPRRIPPRSFLIAQQQTSRDSDQTRRRGKPTALTAALPATPEAKEAYQPSRSALSLLGGLSLLRGHLIAHSFHTFASFYRPVPAIGCGVNQLFEVDRELGCIRSADLAK